MTQESLARDRPSPQFLSRITNDASRPACVAREMKSFIVALVVVIGNTVLPAQPGETRRLRGWAAASLTLAHSGGIVEGGVSTGVWRAGVHVVSVTQIFDNPVQSKITTFFASRSLRPWFFVNVGFGHARETQKTSGPIESAVTQLGVGVIRPSRSGLSGMLFLETFDTFGSVTGSLGGRNDHVQLVLLGVGLIFH